MKAAKNILPSSKQLSEKILIRDLLQKHKEFFEDNNVSLTFDGDSGLVNFAFAW